MFLQVDVGVVETSKAFQGSSVVLSRLETSEADHVLLQVDVGVVETSKAFQGSSVVLGWLETSEADHVLLLAIELCRGLQNRKFSTETRKLLGLEASKNGNETSNGLPGSGLPGVDEHAANGLFHHLEHTSNTGTCFSTTLTCYRIVYFFISDQDLEPLVILRFE